MTKQEADIASIDFDDADTLAFRNRCRSEGLSPLQYTAVKIHTHPGNSAVPSKVDWDDLLNIQMKSLIMEYDALRQMGEDPQPPWQVMAIVAKGGEMTAHIAVYCPQIEHILSEKIKIEVANSIQTQEEIEWLAEYEDKVTKPTLRHFAASDYYKSGFGGHHGNPTQTGGRLFDTDAPRGPLTNEQMVQLKAHRDRQEAYRLGHLKRGNNRESKKARKARKKLEATGGHLDIIVGPDGTAGTELAVHEVNIELVTLHEWQTMKWNFHLCERVVKEWGDAFGIDDSARAKMDVAEIREAANTIYTSLQADLPI